MKSAYPGEQIHINAVALDQFNHTTSAFIGITTSAVSAHTLMELVPHIIYIFCMHIIETKSYQLYVCYSRYLFGI